jgi:hypothetical protein
MSIRQEATELKAKVQEELGRNSISSPATRSASGPPARSTARSRLGSRYRISPCLMRSVIKSHSRHCWPKGRRWSVFTVANGARSAI